MKTSKVLSLILFTLALLISGGCNAPKVPTGNISAAEESPKLIPDYTGITIPPNIAPMNFEIDIPGEEYIVRIIGKDGREILAGGKEVRWDEDEWHGLLESSKGGNLQYEVYVRNGSGWRLYKFANKVAEEEIDPYISYRLIEPTYLQYSGMSLRQRNITNFDEEVIWNNPSPCDENRNYCINCHVPRNQYRDHSSLFHTRGSRGGTIIMTGDSIVKMDLNTDRTLSAGVYPSWHPTLDLIAFSTNTTSQAFPLNSNRKVEVYDSKSDLILYDIRTHTISDISSGEDVLETFPGWSPDGKKIYYSAARYPEGADADNLVRYTSLIHYDILSRDFDPATRTFSKPDTIVYASADSMSAMIPRISPDGKFLLYCKAPYGSFHVWHKESDLYLTDLSTGEERILSNANSDDAESYHSWSSNSRWVVFSSRRDDGNYTRPYIAYISKEGNDSKAFVVPQESTAYYRQLMKSYNAAEFMAEPFAFDREDILPFIRETGRHTEFTP